MLLLSLQLFLIYLSLFFYHFPNSLFFCLLILHLDILFLFPFSLVTKRIFNTWLPTQFINLFYFLNCLNRLYELIRGTLFTWRVRLSWWILFQVMFPTHYIFLGIFHRFLQLFVLFLRIYIIIPLFKCWIVSFVFKWMFVIKIESFNDIILLFTNLL